MVAAITLGWTGVSRASGVAVTDLAKGATATQLAQSLAGDGVSISNVTYTGDPRAAGTFTGGAGSIGFGTGVALSTGKVQTYPGEELTCAKGVEGPNDCNEDSGTVGTTNSNELGQPGDSDLDALVAPNATQDAAVLQFDVVPKQPVVQFSYVFGSEEYNEYANTSFNDVFAFFVNGRNCALVPGTGDPVSVNTINNGNPVDDTTPHNAQYFRDNVRPSPTIDSQMDGLTTVLTCTADVTAGQTNHMKLAIADTSDGAWDAAVFIQAGSLATVAPVSVSANPVNATEGRPFGGTVATFTDANTGEPASAYSATISWGDGASSAGTISGSGGSFSVSGTHAYGEHGSYATKVTVQRSGSLGTANSSASTAAVAEAPLSVSAKPLGATEGQAWSGTIATFTDGDPGAAASEYSATINWGDGATSAGAISGTGGNFAVGGGHTYAERGSYAVTVTVAEVDNAATATSSGSSATIGDAPLTAAGMGRLSSSPSFSGTVATFADANKGSSAADFAATITWGDGKSSAGSVGGATGSYVVKGSHAFPTAGSFAVKVTVSDVDGSTATAVTTVVIATAIGGPPSVASDDVFAGVRHHGKGHGLKIKSEFAGPGNAVWQFNALKPGPAAGSGKLVYLGAIKQHIKHAGSVTVVFKLKPGWQTAKLYKKVLKLGLKTVQVKLTFTAASGQQYVTTMNVKLM
jgi:hypothetical protein